MGIRRYGPGVSECYPPADAFCAFPQWEEYHGLYPACMEKTQKTWPLLTPEFREGKAKTGGMGQWTSREEGVAVWACFEDDACAKYHGAFLAPDAMCYVYGEWDEMFHPWGPNSALRIIDPAAAYAWCDEMCGGINLVADSCENLAMQAKEIGQCAARHGCCGYFDYLGELHLAQKSTLCGFAEWEELGVEECDPRHNDHFFEQCEAMCADEMLLPEPQSCGELESTLGQLRSCLEMSGCCGVWDKYYSNHMALLAGHYLCGAEYEQPTCDHIYSPMLEMNYRQRCLEHCPVDDLFSLAPPPQTPRRSEHMRDPCECNWVPNNANVIGGIDIGYFGSREQCIIAVREQCPGYNIANYGSSGDCWCQSGYDQSVDPFTSYYSCFLDQIPECDGKSPECHELEEKVEALVTCANENQCCLHYFAAAMGEEGMMLNDERCNGNAHLPDCPVPPCKIDPWDYGNEEMEMGFCISRTIEAYIGGLSWWTGMGMGSGGMRGSGDSFGMPPPDFCGVIPLLSSCINPCVCHMASDPNMRNEGNPLVESAWMWLDTVMYIAEINGCEEPKCCDDYRMGSGSGATGSGNGPPMGGSGAVTGGAQEAPGSGSAGGGGGFMPLPPGGDGGASIPPIGDAFSTGGKRRKGEEGAPMQPQDHTRPFSFSNRNFPTFSTWTFSSLGGGPSSWMPGGPPPVELMPHCSEGLCNPFAATQCAMEFEMSMYATDFCSSVWDAWHRTASCMHHAGCCMMYETDFTDRFDLPFPGSPMASSELFNSMCPGMFVNEYTPSCQHYEDRDNSFSSSFSASSSASPSSFSTRVGPRRHGSKDIPEGKTSMDKEDVERRAAAEEKWAALTQKHRRGGEKAGTRGKKRSSTNFGKTKGTRGEMAAGQHALRSALMLIPSKTSPNAPTGASLRAAVQEHTQALRVAVRRWEAAYTAELAHLNKASALRAKANANKRTPAAPGTVKPRTLVPSWILKLAFKAGANSKSIPPSLADHPLVRFAGGTTPATKKQPPPSTAAQAKAQSKRTSKNNAPAGPPGAAKAKKM